MAGKRRPNGVDLWAVASKGAMTDVAIRALARQYLPE